MRCGAVLTAAGSGTRLGHDLPKALVPLSGTPLVVHAARGLAESGVVDAVVVTAPAEHLDAFGELFPGGTVPGGSVPVRVVAGGLTRQASVAAGLSALPDDCTLVLVHDAARALAGAELTRRVVAALAAGRSAVVPGVPVTDTVKRVAPTDDGGEVVVETPDRSALRGIQTPQGFRRELLERAHRAAADRAHDEARAVSDDAGLVELLGERVHLVPGETRALKVTTPADLAVAELLLSRP
ncbi:2-C-methyl-D-erythritol 4-phosphate cytidylyltransferase [uncultured Georgenia sp.]|uniref:2-C-methyl-D-erythritol 4-phosphate cytidylyltransferase n=1 Tax=uncultured Georgenia sp. TaxID=378209 RepID=UPI00261C1491|nr:2-C-methyl-D-erythritol 4-phosphate cytidylyltransferase [uncultured Georgenia sp.]HLV04170.1 2-C-methyl-D-erythritol 4-phosphate cytidylyltransferase [Actinomycetaceae bacterium]